MTMSVLSRQDGRTSARAGRVTTGPGGAWQASAFEPRVTWLADSGLATPLSWPGVLAEEFQQRPDGRPEALRPRLSLGCALMCRDCSHCVRPQQEPILHRTKTAYASVTDVTNRHQYRSGNDPLFAHLPGFKSALFRD